LINADLNLNLLTQKANEIRKAIEDIQNYTMNELENFLEDNTLIDATKYKFLLAMEGCFSICNHLASRIGKRVPEGYSDCFKMIAEIGIITEKLADNLMKMAKFRNLLIHIYWTVEDKKVYEYSKNNLRDIEQFLDEIGNYLKEKI
jgi:uncharacterized protein YutE (UPF0331/DUF86 family)